MGEPPFACSAVGVTRFYFSKRRFFFYRINARTILVHKHSLWLFIEFHKRPAVCVRHRRSFVVSRLLRERIKHEAQIPKSSTPMVCSVVSSVIPDLISTKKICFRKEADFFFYAATSIISNPRSNWVKSMSN